MGLAGMNPVDVAAQGVDLAVVDDVAVGVGALPAGRGVGGVAGVDQGHGRLRHGVVEVEVEAAHLGCHQHALVDHGPGAHRAYIEDAVGQGRLGLGALLDHAAADVELALEDVPAVDGLGAADKGLDDGGHAGPGRPPQVMGVDGHVAPEEQGDAPAGASVLKDPLGHAHALLVLGHEEHGHAVVALVGQKAAALLRLLAEETVGHLEEDAGAVTRVALQAGAAAVLQVDEDREGVVEHLVGPHTLEAGQGADAAGVVLELGAVQGIGHVGRAAVERWVVGHRGVGRRGVERAAGGRRVVGHAAGGRASIENHVIKHHRGLSVLLRYGEPGCLSRPACRRLSHLACRARLTRLAGRLSPWRIMVGCP